jgi:hypothetical protein
MCAVCFLAIYAERRTVLCDACLARGISLDLARQVTDPKVNIAWRKPVLEGKNACLSFIHAGPGGGYQKDNEVCRDSISA